MNIPNLPFGAMTDKEGMPNSSELTFRQNLVTELQKNVGKFYFAFPQVTAADITMLEAATVPNPVGGVLYTTPFGAGVYNTTANSIMFSVDNGSGQPLFKTVTLV